MTKPFYVFVSMTFLFNITLFSKTVSCSSQQSTVSCLVCNCYHESRGESYEGQVAVSKTVLSRALLKSNEFPKTVCENVYKKWQFSWTNDKIKNEIDLDDTELAKITKNENFIQDLIDKKSTFHKTKLEKHRLTETEAYLVCQNSVKISMQEGANGLIYFYDPRIVVPRWAKSQKACGRIGNHIFLVPPDKLCPASLGTNQTKTQSPIKKNNSIN